MYAPQVSQPLLESYLRWLHGYRKANGLPLTVSSQTGKLSAVQNFWRWLLKRHVILYNPADLLELARPEKRLPAQVFSERETRRGQKLKVQAAAETPEAGEDGQPADRPQS